MSSVDADLVFQQLAEVTIAATAAAAEYDQRSQISRPRLPKPEPNFLKSSILSRSSSRIISSAHPERFIKPRMRQTEFGKYGLRTVTNLQITDEVCCHVRKGPGYSGHRRYRKTRQEGPPKKAIS